MLDNHFEKVKNEVSFYENDIFKIDIEKLKKHIEYKAYLYYMLKGCFFTEWSDIEGLLSGQSGKFVNSKTHRLIKDRDFLLLEENNLHLPQLKTEISEDITKIDMPISLSFEQVNQVGFSAKNNIYVNVEMLEYPLHLRRKEEGDYFFPFGI